MLETGACVADDVYINEKPVNKSSKPIKNNIVATTRLTKIDNITVYNVTFAI